MMLSLHNDDALRAVPKSVPTDEGLQLSTREPQELSAEKIDLESLIHHYSSVAHDLPLEEVHRIMREQSFDYFAIIREGRVTGLCSRARVGFVLGSRFGFALNSRSPAYAAQVAHPLVFTSETPVRLLLDIALARPAEEFHEDIVLVDNEHHLLGLIPVQAMARLQSRLVGEQLGALRSQHETMRRQNLDLFQANHALRQAQGLYRSLFESNATGVALLDLHGVVQAHNRRFAELLHIPLPSQARFSLLELVSLHEQFDFREMLQAHERIGAQPTTKEFHLELGNRGMRLFRIATGWVQETGQICACIDDISEQRAIERHLQREEKQLLLDTLVGGIAHELNNKLTPVMGFAQLLELEVGARGLVYTQYIGKSVQEAANIIRQLLQLSKPETGQPEVLNLGRVLEESLLMLKFQLREARVRLELPECPAAAVVFADPSQVKQVLMNLVINAVHAMAGRPEPKLTITLGRKSGFGCIEVTDNGVGMSPQIMERIFDPFFTTKQPDKGSGLGLSICYSLVHQQGGKISVDSKPGVGASFTVSLPLAASDLEEFPPPMHPSVVVEIPPRVGTLRRVLIVEDEDVVRKLLQEVFRTRLSCRVDVAVNGAEGLRIALLNRYDLVVSDVRMPEMSGPEFLLHLRETQPDIVGRFVLVTGHEGEENLSDVMAHWKVPLIQKPFSVQQLIDVCGSLLGLASRSAAATGD
jgi:signal transduction histidine kinase